MSPLAGGLVFVPLDRQDRTEVSALVNAAMDLVADGRTLAVSYPSDGGFSEQPFEAWLVETVLGVPQGRNTSGFNFFADLIVRAYGQDRTHPNRTICVALFRREGEAPYRRKDEAGTPLAADRLNIEEVSFTRDWANNVWHVPDGPQTIDHIVSRLARLVCWSDECLLKVDDRGATDISGLRDGQYADLVPVATKCEYVWPKGEGVSQQLRRLERV